MIHEQLQTDGQVWWCDGVQAIQTFSSYYCIHRLEDDELIGFLVGQVVPFLRWIINDLLRFQDCCRVHLVECHNILAVE